MHQSVITTGVEVVREVKLGCNPFGSRGCTGGVTCNDNFSFKSSKDHRMTYRSVMIKPILF